MARPACAPATGPRSLLGQAWALLPDHLIDSCSLSSHRLCHCTSRECAEGARRRDIRHSRNRNSCSPNGLKVSLHTYSTTAHAERSAVLRKVHLSVRGQREGQGAASPAIKAPLQAGPPCRECAAQQQQWVTPKSAQALKLQVWCSTCSMPLPGICAAGTFHRQVKPEWVAQIQHAVLCCSSRSPVPQSCAMHVQPSQFAANLVSGHAATAARQTSC
jgi:hypothetical protein